MVFKACMSLLGHTVYYMVWPNKGTHALKTIVARTAFHKLRWRTGSDQALCPTKPFLPTNQALRSPPQGLWLKWHMALDLKVGVWSGLPVGSPCAAPPAHQQPHTPRRHPIARSATTSSRHRPPPPPQTALQRNYFETDDGRFLVR